MAKSDLLAVGDLNVDIIFAGIEGIPALGTEVLAGRNERERTAGHGRNDGAPPCGSFPARGDYNLVAVHAPD